MLYIDQGHFLFDSFGLGSFVIRERKHCNSYERQNQEYVSYPQYSREYSMCLSQFKLLGSARKCKNERKSMVFVS